MLQRLKRLFRKPEAKPVLTLENATRDQLVLALLNRCDVGVIACGETFGQLVVGFRGAPCNMDMAMRMLASEIEDRRTRQVLAAAAN